MLRPRPSIPIPLDSSHRGKYECTSIRRRDTLVAESSALGLDKPRPTDRAARIDADRGAHQIRDHMHRCRLLLVIRLTGNRWFCPIISLRGRVGNVAWR